MKSYNLLDSEIVVDRQEYIALLAKLERLEADHKAWEATNTEVMADTAHKYALLTRYRALLVKLATRVFVANCDYDDDRLKSVIDEIDAALAAPGQGGEGSVTCPS